MTDGQSEVHRQIAEQNKNQNVKPACPKCGRLKSVIVHGPHDFTCLNCKMDFDGIDDGDVSYGRPDRRMIREERRRKQRKGGKE